VPQRFKILLKKTSKKIEHLS